MGDQHHNMNHCKPGHFILAQFNNRGAGVVSKGRADSFAFYLNIYNNIYVFANCYVKVETTFLHIILQFKKTDTWKNVMLICIIKKKIQQCFPNKNWQIIF